MKDHERRELVNRLTKLAQEYANSQQLRERIAREVLPALDAAVAAERAWFVQALQDWDRTEDVEDILRLRLEHD